MLAGAGAEDRRQLEQAHVLLLAAAVVRDRIEQAGQQRRPHHRHRLGERVGDGDDVSASAAKRRAASRAMNEKVTLSEKPAARGQRPQPARRASAAAPARGGGSSSGGNVVGDPVVAVDAGDLLDQVDLARRRRRASSAPSPSSRRRSASARRRSRARSGSARPSRRRSCSRGRGRCGPGAASAPARRRRLRPARRSSRDAACPAPICATSSQGAGERRWPRRRSRRRARSGARLPSPARAACSCAAPGAGVNHALSTRDGRRGAGDLGVGAAHDAAEALRARRVGDDEHVGRASASLPSSVRDAARRCRAGGRAARSAPAAPDRRRASGGRSRAARSW